MFLQVVCSRTKNMIWSYRYERFRGELILYQELENSTSTGFNRAKNENIELIMGDNVNHLPESKPRVTTEVPGSKCFQVLSTDTTD